MYPFAGEGEGLSSRPVADADFSDSSDDFDFESSVEEDTPSKEEAEPSFSDEEDVNDSYTWLVKGLNRMYTRAMDSDTLSFPPTVDSRITDFIRMCLCPVPYERPALEALVAHPLFDDIVKRDSSIDASSDGDVTSGSIVSASRANMSQDLTANEIGKGLLKFEQRAAYKVDLDITLSPEQEVLLMYHSTVNVFNIISELINMSKIDMAQFPELRDTIHRLGTIVAQLVMAPEE
ncbi:hypothetical protein KIPB_009960, partial [Kipferlia bialata]|eukprot:g9960.t1